MIHKQRYTGTKWAIIYGSYESVEAFAVNELQRMVQLYMPYVLEILPQAGQAGTGEHNLILVGTCANNHLIRELVDNKQIDLPAEQQGYTIKCCDSPWNKQRRIVVIAGTDSNGVLYGVQDFNARLCIASDLPGEEMYATKKHGLFDKLKDFTVHEHPLIENRGIWTWGYVIYDYQRFIDNMARLRMNMLTIWNDRVPVNCKEVIDYAHSRGIKVMLASQWGWGTDYDLTDPEHRQQIKDDAIKRCLEEYRDLGMDGIYFQTLTEHHDKELGGKPVAELICELINDITSEIFAHDPDLYFQFGIHAISIMDSFDGLKSLDPRITIAWEDAGLIPYAYNPVTEAADAAGQGVPCGVDTQDSTIAYSKQLAMFRKDPEFAMVAKGWTCLNWDDEFEHHSSFILGHRDRSFITQRLAQLQSRWDKINDLWLKNYRHAMEFYREILSCKVPAMTVTGLIEDGLFEEAIQPSVALFAETLWDPQRDPEEILQRAMNPYYGT